MNSVGESQNTDSKVTAEDHHLRSLFMADLIARPTDPSREQDHQEIPRTIIQFWDDIRAVPADVQGCLDTWASLENTGFTRLLFDDVSAGTFIERHFTPRHVLAFARCSHPAMRADYCRLAFILKNGGCYVDADDEYQGVGLDDLLTDSRLKLQPLCYDIATDSMINPKTSASAGKVFGRIFYVNNNPLVGPPGHPVVAMALERATTHLLEVPEGDRDIQSLTGPGNLTACLVAHAIERQQSGDLEDFELLSNWDTVAVSKWPLAYRADQRNWRHWVRGDD